MICKECNFENKDGAAFCANCGKPLPAESASAMEPIKDEDEKTTIIEPEVKAEEKAADDSEANTTVLTSNTPMGGVAPMGAPAPSPAPQGFNQGPKPGTPTPGAPMKPMGAPTPMGAPAPMGAPMNKPPMGQAPMNKPAQAPAGKPAKPVKAKKSKGTIAYIVISIILILGLTGVGVWGYFHYTDEIDKVKEEKATLEADLTAQYEGEIATLQSDISTLETTVSDYETTFALYDEEISSLEAQIEDHAQYDDLIAAADLCTPQGSTTFFASNNFIHLSSGESAEIKVFYENLEGTVYYELQDSSIATCEWGDTWENAETTATLTVTGVSSGYTTIEITNTTDDQLIEIVVYVD